MPTAYLYSTEFDENVSNGFVQYDYIKIYKVEADDTTTDVVGILGSSGLPARFSPLILDGTVMYCWRRIPVRVAAGDQPDRKMWLVRCHFTNDTSKFLRNEDGQPVDDPSDAAPAVDVSFFETSEPIKKLVFLGCYDENETLVATNTALKPNQESPFINSAGDPMQRDRRKWDKQITYWKWYASYDNNWESVVGQVNDASVTVTQSDTTGAKFAQTYAARELLLVDIIKQDRWMQGRLYFRIGFVMLKSTSTWKIREIDRGTRQQIFAGQYKKDGTQWTSGEVSTVTSAGYFMQEIPTYDDEGVQNGLVGEPVPLNGWGAPVPHKRQGGGITDNKTYFLDFLEFNETSFSPLGLA